MIAFLKFSFHRKCTIFVILLSKKYLQRYRSRVIVIACKCMCACVHLSSTMYVTANVIQLGGFVCKVYIELDTYTDTHAFTTYTCVFLL